jgi:tetratricopeptide (TPR) repeat protein
MLLDRKRIKFWQRWVFAIMAVLMFIFLIFGYTGVFNGCSSGAGQTQSVADQIEKLKAQLAASPGTDRTLRLLGEAYIGAAQQQQSGSQNWTNNMATAADYLEQYDARLAEKSGLEAKAARVDNLQQLAAIYSQLQEYEKLMKAYARLTELQPDNADNFVFYGIAASNAGNDHVALISLGRYLELAPDGQYADQVKARIKELMKTASPTSSPTAKPSSSVTP